MTIDFNNGESKKLDIFSSASNPTYGLVGGLRFSWYTNNNAEIQMIRGGSSNDGAGLAFLTSANTSGAVERMRIERNGNVGIGATAPTAKLQINSLSTTGASTYPGDILIDDSAVNGPSAVGGLEFKGSGSDSGYGYKLYSNNSSNYLGIATRHNSAAWTERMVIKSDTGNVGIGTVSPDADLKVAGVRSNTIASSAQIAAIGGDDVYTRFGTLYGSPSWGSWIQVSNDTGSALPLLLNPNGGNIGVGTNNPVSKLDVNGILTLDAGGNYLYTYGRYTSAGGNILFNNGSGDNLLLAETASGKYTFGKGSAGAAPTNITLSLDVTNGNVGIGTTAPAEKLEVSGNAKATSFIYSSDRNLKQNIQPISNPLGKIMQLEGVTFNWKKDNTPSVGLIAQDVEKVFPELVTGEEGHKGVSYGNLVAPLIEAVKEQQKEIETLKLRVIILERQNSKSK